jgi:uncharacterized protein YgiM (DUF1202 family)
VTNKIIFALIIAFNASLAFAQDAANADKDRQYVTDQLRLSLYEEASSKSKVVKLLQSGDMLLVEEIRGAYAFVIAPGDVRGWVKRGFLVTTPTATILLTEERDKNARLLEEMEKLGNSKVIIDTYEKDMDKLIEKLSVLEAEKLQVNENMAALQQELEITQQNLEQARNNREPIDVVLRETFQAYWKFIVPALLAMLLVCFLITKIAVEARIKARFHGIKIW